MTKPAITKRSVKGAALTFDEQDANFQNLKDATINITAGTGGTGVSIDLNGNLTLVAGTGVTLTGDNTAKTITVASTASNNIFSTIAVAGQSSVVADSTTDTLTLVAGSNVTLTTNAATDTITIATSVSGVTNPLTSDLNLSTYKITSGSNVMVLQGPQFKLLDDNNATEYLTITPGNDTLTLIDSPDNTLAIRALNSSGQVESLISLDSNGLGISLSASYSGSESGSITFSDGVTRHVGITTTERNAIGSPFNGMMIYNSTTNKFQGYVGGAWADLNALTPGPAFRANPETTQTIASGSTLVKVNFGSELFDTNNNFASSRFTPTVAGYYQLNSTVRLDGGGNGTGECMIVIFKNGSEYARGWNSEGTQFASSFWSMSVSDVAYANGSTDYFEIYIQQGSGGNRTTSAYTNISHFSGALVRTA
jgi:hypothetical protein